MLIPTATTAQSDSPWLNQRAPSASRLKCAALRHSSPPSSLHAHPALRMHAVGRMKHAPQGAHLQFLPTQSYPHWPRTSQPEMSWEGRGLLGAPAAARKAVATWARVETVHPETVSRPSANAPALLAPSSGRLTAKQVQRGAKGERGRYGRAGHYPFSRCPPGPWGKTESASRAGRAGRRLPWATWRRKFGVNGTKCSATRHVQEQK